MFYKMKCFVKRIIYKFVFYWINRDRNLAYETGIKILKDEIIKRELIRSDMQKSSSFWLNMFQYDSDIWEYIFTTESSKVEFLKEKIVDNMELFKRFMKMELSDFSELRKEAQDWLLGKEDYQKEVVSYLYGCNLLLNEIEKYMLQDVHLSRKLVEFYFDKYMNDKHEIGLRRDIFRRLAINEIIGGVSTCKYSSEKYLIQITGWFFPCSNYDKVVVTDCGKFIGEAILRIRRLDIYQKYPFASEKYAGWQFQLKNFKISEERNIEVTVLKGKKIIFKTKPDIEYVISEDLSVWNEKTISRSERLQIYKNQSLMEELDVSGGKEFLKSFEFLDKCVRADKGNGWSLLQKIGNEQLEVQLLEAGDGLVTEIEREELSELLRYCKEGGFYQKYIINYNHRRVSADAAFLKQYIPKDAAILDIGAVPPILEQYLIKLGYEDLTVWDPNVADFEDFFREFHIKSNAVDIFSISEEKLQSKYDMVVFAEVLEHLTGDISEVIIKLRKCIKTGGFLYLTTPNLKSISGLHSIFNYGNALASKCHDTVYAQYERVKKNGYYGHVREYTDNEVVRLMKDFEFELVKTSKMPEFRDENILVYNLEKIYPGYGLFGKYLFKKVTIDKKI